MSDYSIMQEHTLVLAGDTVDSGSVWQGWPSNQITPLEIYRKYVLHLVDKAVFQQTKNIPSFASSRRQKDRQDMQYEMMEESKNQHYETLRNGNLKMSNDGSTSLNQQKRVSFKTMNSPVTSLASAASTPVKDSKFPEDNDVTTAAGGVGETTPLLKK